MSEQRTRRIGFFIFDGLLALDLMGPMDVFAATRYFHQPGMVRYELCLISPDGKPVKATNGARLSADYGIADAPPLHTLIIPGGFGARQMTDRPDVLDWISAQASTLERLCSVCTGLFILARTGALQGKEVTTHWAHIQEARTEFPDVSVREDVLYLQDGNIVTTAGVTAGIDMALALVEADMGHAVASGVSKDMVVFLHRTGGQKQFSSLLKHQSVDSDRFADLLVWIADHLTENLSSEALAERMKMSDRHFRRAFEKIYSESPAKAVANIRIEVAKDWLVSSRKPMGEVGALVGFKSTDTFSRSFKKLAGVSPTDYRKFFQTTKSEKG